MLFRSSGSSPGLADRGQRSSRQPKGKVPRLEDGESFFVGCTEMSPCWRGRFRAVAVPNRQRPSCKPGVLDSKLSRVRGQAA